MNKVFDRAGNIERRDRELGGFLTIFAALPGRSRDKILQEIAALRERLAGDPEAFMDEVKAMAAVHGAVQNREGHPIPRDMGSLTFRMDEIGSAAQELNRKIH